MTSDSSSRRLRRGMRSAVLAVGLVAVGGLAPASAQSPPPMAAPSPTTPAVDLSMPHDVPDLEALFPDSVDGSPLFKLSMGRPTLEALADQGMGQLDVFVSELGIERTDLELAFANDPTADPLFNYLAFRAAGITGPALVEAYARMVPQAEASATTRTVTIDGREVTSISMPSNPLSEIWFWTEGDALVGIQTVDLATLERLYRLMPGQAGPPAGSPTASAAA